jgi:ABC-2 type transport system ATP-binding protein
LETIAAAGLTAAVSGGVGALGRVVAGLERDQVGVLDIGLRRPTLDDVFLSLTGHASAPDTAGADGADPSTAPSTAPSTTEVTR